jgi:hypothetical protein
VGCEAECDGALGALGGANPSTDAGGGENWGLGAEAGGTNETGAGVAVMGGEGALDIAGSCAGRVELWQIDREREGRGRGSSGREGEFRSICSELAEPTFSRSAPANHVLSRQAGQGGDELLG